MDMENKNRECLECGCNIFTIRKIRDTNSVLNRTGSRLFTCVDCDSFENKWETKEDKSIVSKTLERLEKRNTRLQRENDRMRLWMDNHFEQKLKSQ